MTTKAKGYIAAVCLVGLVLAAGCVHTFVHSLVGVAFESYGWRIIFLVCVCAVCRSLPIVMANDQALDLSVIGILAAYLTDGTSAAVVVYLLASLFTFERERDGSLRSIYTVSLVKTLFNTGDIVIAIVVPGLLCRLLPWQAGQTELPVVLLPTLVFSVFTFVVNYFMLLMMFRLNGEISTREMLQGVSGLTPNVLAAMPLGLILALVLMLPSGPWLALLVVAPLLLARYAWKLYLDARRHKEELITAFVSALEARDPYTRGHSRRVSEYAVRIAREMRLPPREMDLIREGAMLHDIGKIGITDAILHKPARLTDEEWARMQQHPAIGADIVADLALNGDVVEMIRSHHERCDGSGYPDALSAGQLKLSTRILAVADAYDAMTSDRPYRKGMSCAAALNELQAGAGAQFDRDVVAAMMRVMETEALAQ